MHHTPFARSLAPWLGATAIWFAAATAFAQPASSAAGTSPPKRVTIGMYVNQIDNVSLKDSQVTVDFHIWFRWTDDDLKPIETFDLVNGKIDTKEDVVTLSNDGYKYACCRVLATIHKLWNVSHFPLDAHDIAIAIEDGEYESFKVEYVADMANSGLNPEAEAAGWSLVPLGATVEPHEYNTNYGDISLPTGHASIYSRFVYSVGITRPGYGMFLKLFTGLFIAAAIAFHALLIRPTELDARFGLAVGAMFAAVASEYVVVSSLPDSNYLTLADKLHILTFGFVFLSLAVSVLSSKFANQGHENRSWWLDRLAFVGMSSAYTILVASAILIPY
ncbi:MAG TPA: hypothetical protein VHZ24_19260 [Pirellulales bacterium]|jgi:hypothetical protein|nr:hypothetical protein [Pirellulales bacterium]